MALEFATRLGIEPTGGFYLARRLLCEELEDADGKRAAELSLDELRANENLGTDALFHYLSGWYQTQLIEPRDLSAAEQSFRAALEADRDHFASLLMIAWIHNLQNQWERAIEPALRASILHPQYYGGYQSLAQSYALCVCKKVDEEDCFDPELAQRAIEYYSMSIDRGSPGANDHRSKGMMVGRLGDHCAKDGKTEAARAYYEMVEASFSTAIEITHGQNERRPVATDYLNRSYARVKLDQHAAAVEDVRAMLELEGATAKEYRKAAIILVSCAFYLERRGDQEGVELAEWCASKREFCDRMATEAEE